MKSKAVNSWLELRDLEGLHDDFSEQFEDTKRNAQKLLKFIELWDEIKPHGYKPIQIWRVKIERVTK